MLSIWEKTALLDCDVAIVGGGISGLSAAISLKEQAPKIRVKLLERGFLPSGASTRNAGFACFGSLTELLHDIEVMGEQRMVQLVSYRWQGLELLRKRLKDDHMEFDQAGGFEILSESQLGCLDKIDEINRLLYPIFGRDVYSSILSGDRSFVFGAPFNAGMIYNPLEGHLHTGKMMRSLTQLAISLGVEIHTGSEVEAIGGDGPQPKLKVHNHASNAKLEITCSKLLLCTNAFTHKLFGGMEINPGRGVVLVTKPLEKLSFRGAYHYDEGYFYFRDLGNRILFGGGRNHFFEQETTTSFDVPDNVLELLKAQLEEIVAPGLGAEVDYVWAGIMAFGKEKAPLLGQIQENIYAGVRLGGMGVAIGSKIGEELSQYALGQKEPQKLMLSKKD